VALFGHLGTIKPSRIDLKLTPALALPAPSRKGDDDWIADLTALREQIRSAPADALLDVVVTRS
jgi:hypothetical protein